MRGQHVQPGRSIPLRTRLLGRAGRRPTLFLLVYGASLGLVAATAIALVSTVSQQITSAAIESSVSSDRSLVRSFVAGSLHPTDMTTSLDATRLAEIERQLAALVDPLANGIVQVKVYGTDGIVLYGSRPDLRGQAAGVDLQLAQAIRTGETVSMISALDGSEADTVAGTGTVGTGPDSRVLEAYLPIVAGGRVEAVFETYRNARPILDAVDATRRDVLIVTLLAAGFLAVLLYLIFQAAQRRLTQQTIDLVEAGRSDALTGLLNHGAIVARLTDLLEDARTGGNVVGLAIIDLDNFRLINETHGHAAGDQALLSVARTLVRELSSSSVLGRFGPDEFLVVAPTQCVADLEPAIERLRVRLVDLSLQFGLSERLPVTVSTGICFSPVDGDAATELLSVATVTLGEAKASGGDAIRIAGPGTDLQRAAAQTSFDVLQGLVIAVDAKDRYTKRHSEDVARYALFLADQLGLDPTLRRTLGTAGLLHDVGKIGIPDGILRKPAALTDEEYAIVKQHVALGVSIVRDVPDLDTVRGGIRHHHERWDGTGYLDGLAGEAIPLVGRILAVADAFSAMTTTRPYRKALDVREAIRRLEDAAGSQLDPRLVSAFVTGIETVPSAPLPGMDRPPALLWTPRMDVA